MSFSDLHRVFTIFKKPKSEVIFVFLDLKSDFFAKLLLVREKQMFLSRAVFWRFLRRQIFLVRFCYSHWEPDSLILTTTAGCIGCFCLSKLRQNESTRFLCQSYLMYFWWNNFPIFWSKIMQHRCASCFNITLTLLRDRIIRRTSNSIGIIIDKNGSTLGFFGWVRGDFLCAITFLSVDSTNFCERFFAPHFRNKKQVLWKHSINTKKTLVSSDF